MFELFNSSTFQIIKSVFELFVLSFLFYQLYSILKRTKSTEIIWLSVGFYALLLVSRVCSLNLIASCLEKIQTPYLVFVVIVYGGELKKLSFRSFVSNRRGESAALVLSGEEADAILSAVTTLSNQKRGALIVIPRNVQIPHIVETGVVLNAQLSSALLLSIFQFDTPLHDGAVIIERGKISAAGCFLPLSERQDIKKTLGTRHRAALGMAESADAVVIVVSEETRQISICFGNNFYQALRPDEFHDFLLNLSNYASRDFASVSPQVQ